MPFSEELLTFRRRGTCGVAFAGSGLGDVQFTVSPGHATVIRYEARVRAVGSSTVVATRDLGRPTPYNGVAVVNLAALLNSLSAGDYTVSIAATDAGGTDDSTPSGAIMVPLEAP